MKRRFAKTLQSSHVIRKNLNRFVSLSKDGDHPTVFFFADCFKPVKPVAGITPLLNTMPRPNVKVSYFVERTQKQYRLLSSGREM